MKKTTTAVPEGSLKNKNFGLTPASFQELLEALKAGEDEMYQRVFLAHFDDCLKYLKKNFGARHRHAYDAGMDALVIFYDRLKDGRIKYGNLRYLFTQIAVQNYLKFKKDDRRTTELTEDLELIDAPDIDIPPDALATFEEAWPKLGDNCKKLLKSFFTIESN